jgi:hypothetical protein
LKDPKRNFSELTINWMERVKGLGHYRSSCPKSPVDCTSAGPVSRYRFVPLPLVTVVGPSWDNVRQAREDAVAAGLGSRDEHDGDRISLDESIEI